MRRLVYLALVVVLLATVGLAFLRVTTTGAYMTRSLKMRLKEGMTRQDVHRIVGRAPDRAHIPPNAKRGRDFWHFDNVYHLHIGYDADTGIVLDVGCWKDTKVNNFDRLLEFLGYPEVPQTLP